MHYMELGGAEMALVGLLNALDPERVDVDLFIYDHRGPLMQYIPKWINLLPEKLEYAVLETSLKNCLRKGQLGVAIGRIMSKVHYRWQSIWHKIDEGREDISVFHYLGQYTSVFLPRINPNVEYDLCISFLLPHNIALKNVKARKRLAWIHTDYSTVSVNEKAELPVWRAYDYIASISQDVKQSFLRTFPSLEHKVIEIENIMSSKFVRRRSEEFDARQELDGEVKLLSIGRYTYAKNYDNLPEIARQIVECGVKNLRWYIIGFGGQEELLRQKIAENGMENHVILLGKKENPYPYIKACDIYVQPSRYEGKSIAVREAQLLGKPVAVTNFPTAKSQINDGVDGVIVPLDNEGCAHGIVDFITDTKLRQGIINYLSTNDLGNECEVEKIYALLK